MATVLIIGSLLLICISQIGMYNTPHGCFCCRRHKTHNYIRWLFVCRIWRLKRICTFNGPQNNLGPNFAKLNGSWTKRFKIFDRAYLRIFWESKGLTYESLSPILGGIRRALCAMTIAKGVSVSLYMMHSGTFSQVHWPTRSCDSKQLSILHIGAGMRHLLPFPQFMRFYSKTLRFIKVWMLRQGVL